jgi:hypothetical protein
MSVFCSIGGCHYGFSPYHPPVAADNPTSDKKRVPGCHMPTKSNSEFNREGFSPGCSDGLGHRFIENRTDNAPMNDSAKSFPDALRSPSGGHFAVGLPFKPYSQPMRVLLPANKTARLHSGM